MQRQIRNYFAMACLALCTASFPSSLWLFYQYQSTRPTQPQPERGLIHALGNHGTNAYLSDAECTEIAILDLMFISGFGLTVAVVKKRYTQTGFEHDLRNPTAKEYGVWFVLTVCYLGIIMFAGPGIVAAMVSHGIVLTFGTN